MSFGRLYIISAAFYNPAWVTELVGPAYTNPNATRERSLEQSRASCVFLFLSRLFLASLVSALTDPRCLTLCSCPSNKLELKKMLHVMRHPISSPSVTHQTITLHTHPVHLSWFLLLKSLPFLSSIVFLKRQRNPRSSRQVILHVYHPSLANASAIVDYWFLLDYVRKKSITRFVQWI